LPERAPAVRTHFAVESAYVRNERGAGRVDAGSAHFRSGRGRISRDREGACREGSGLPWRHGSGWPCRRGRARAGRPGGQGALRQVATAAPGPPGCGPGSAKGRVGVGVPTARRRPAHSRGGRRPVGGPPAPTAVVIRRLLTPPAPSAVHAPLKPPAPPRGRL